MVDLVYILQLHSSRVALMNGKLTLAQAEPREARCEVGTPNKTSTISDMGVQDDL